MKRILFLYNQVSEKEKTGSFGKCALKRDIDTIREALQRSGNFVYSLDLLSLNQLSEYVKKIDTIDFAFVIAEGYKELPHTLYNGNGAALIRKDLEELNIPFSHSSIESMVICRNKDMTYARLTDNNVLVPNYIVFNSNFLNNIEAMQDEVEKIGYPLIIKPVGGGNSIGISQDSVVYNFYQLKKKIEELHQQLGTGGYIIEKYLTGREYTVGIIGNRDDKYILPVIGFPENQGIRDILIKKIEHTKRENFEIIDEKNSNYCKIIDAGIKTFSAVNARDIIRIDMREDANGNIYVIDVNGTPALSQTGSLSFMAERAGLACEQLVQLVLYENMKRLDCIPNIFFEEVVQGLRSKLKVFNTIEVA